jgi:hypothetical protein
MDKVIFEEGTIGDKICTGIAIIVSIIFIGFVHVFAMVC